MVLRGRRFDPTPAGLAFEFAFTLALAAFLTSAACAGRKLEPASSDGDPAAEAVAEGSSSEPEDPHSGSTEVSRLEKALKSAGEDQKRLREAVAERDTEITALEEAKASLELELQSALEELIRSQANVRNVQSRAFAVSRIAEVRVEVKTFRTRKDPALKDRLDRAEDFLDRADRALQDDNVGGAAYLAERASELLRQVKTVAEIRSREPKELIPVVPPREIEVGASANLRKAPSSESERVGSVDPGTKLKAIARQGEWYEVETEDGREVWIHRRLVR